MIHLTYVHRSMPGLPGESVLVYADSVDANGENFTTTIYLEIDPGECSARTRKSVRPIALKLRAVRFGA